MKIKMLSTQNGSLDGICISTYTVGTEYDLGDTAQAKSLAKAFIGARMAIEVPLETTSAVIEKPASAGFFTPVYHHADGTLSPEIHGDGSGEMLKAIESAPENKMVKRAYTRKAK